MPFTSYAQNFEDALLWRALHDVERGFWIDVGAADPVYESVTKAFSLAGWRGVNAEASKSAFALLTADRPDDVNLYVVVGDHEGTATFFSIGDGNGLSTTDPAIADRHREVGWSHDVEQLPATTLAAICRDHAPADIHFLKIDVEGGETAVLRGADFAAHRPWIVMVEAVAPVALRDAEGNDIPFDGMPTDSHADWEPILLGADYRFVLFDGVNRVYVAAEHLDRLGPRLAVPVNVFDDCRRHTDVDREARLEEVEAELVHAEAALQRSNEESRRRVDELTATLEHRTIEMERQVAEHHTVLGAAHDEITRLRDELELALQYHFQCARALAAMTSKAQVAESEVHRRDQLLGHQSTDIHRLTEENQRLTGLAEHREAVLRELDAMRASKAWRLTAPLRGVRRWFRPSRGG